MTEITKEQEKICQFYIVLGNHDKTFQNDEEHRFFQLKGNEDTNLIQYALAEEWKKKKKEHIKVANEIIFLVPDISFKDEVKELMDKLNCRGKFRVLKPIKKEIKEEPKKEPIIETKPKEEPKEEKIVPPVVLEEKKELPTEPLPIKEEPDNTSDITPIKSDYKESNIYHKEIKEDNIYHKEVEFPNINNKKKKKEKEEDKDVSNYMWGNLDKKELTSKKIDLPIIVFIISALFLIGAVVLIFVLK